MLLIGLTIATACISLFVALITLLKNPASRLHRWLFIFIFMSCAWIVLVNLQGAFHGQWSTKLLRLAFVAASLLGYAMLQFIVALCKVHESFVKSFVDLGLLAFAVFLAASEVVIVDTTAIITNTSELIVPDRGWGYPMVVFLVLTLLCKPYGTSSGRPEYSGVLDERSFLSLSWL